MKRQNIVTGLLAGILLCAYQGSLLAATINLHNTATIRDAQRVGLAIHRLSGKVMRCVARHGGKPGNCVCRDACTCRFKQDYAAVRMAFKQAIRRHPGWAGNIVIYHTPAQPRGFSVSFSTAMEHHFSKRCHKQR